MTSQDEEGRKNLPYLSVRFPSLYKFLFQICSLLFNKIQQKSINISQSKIVESVEGDELVYSNTPYLLCTGTRFYCAKKILKFVRKIEEIYSLHLRYRFTYQNSQRKRKKLLLETTTSFMPNL